MPLLMFLRLELWPGYMRFLDEVTFSSTLSIKWGTGIPLVLPLCRLVCLCPSSQACPHHRPAVPDLHFQPMPAYHFLLSHGPCWLTLLSPP